MSWIARSSACVVSRDLAEIYMGVGLPPAAASGELVLEKEEEKVGTEVEVEDKTPRRER